MAENMVVKIQIPNSFPYNMDSIKAQDPTTIIPENKKDTPLEGVN